MADAGPSMGQAKPLPPCDQERKVLGRVIATFAAVHARTIDHDRVIWHGVVRLFVSLRSWKSFKPSQMELVDVCQLAKHCSIAAVVGKFMKTELTTAQSLNPRTT